MKYEDLNLNKETMPEEISINANNFFLLCRNYYHYYLKYQHINKCSKYLVPLLSLEKDEIIDKFEHIIFVNKFYELYKCFNVKKFHELSENISRENKIYICKKIKENVYIYYSKNEVEKKYNKLCNAMNILKEADNIPAPSIEESVNAVLTEDTINMFYEMIECHNYVGFFMTIARIRRAIFDSNNSDSYNSYCKNDKSRTTCFFNLYCKYNYYNLKCKVEDYLSLLLIYKEIMSIFE